MSPSVKNHMMKTTTCLLFPLLFALISLAQTISVKLPDSLSKKSLDGRLLLIFSKDSAREPRMQISDAPATQQVFGLDIENWQPGTTKMISLNAFGYPIEKIADIPAGEYNIQAVMHLY